MSDTADAALASHVALERLLADTPALARLLPAGYLDAAQRFVALLLSANQRLNLTRVTDPAEVARLHLLDALAALPILDALGGEDRIDLGSGGGVPAIPLAMARADEHWTLVDSVGKKATALREMAEGLGLRNVTVLAQRAETLGRNPLHRESHQVVTARACAALPVLAELALPLLRVGGHLLAWKGPLAEHDEEIRLGRLALAEIGGEKPRIIEPGLEALGGHRFVVAAKERETPARFPRRPGEPARRPLG
jgi:16S rRNA (guanine527-N7)-methyltransferase